MRINLTFMLLLAAFLQVSAASTAQTVTLKRTNAPLEQVLKEIKKQTGYKVFYNNNMLKSANPVTADISGLELTTALDIIFKDQPLTYTIQDKTIIVKVKETVVPQKAEQGPPAPPKDITGHVETKEGVVLNGATVILKRTNSGTLTDEKGNFVLKGVLSSDVIQVSYIGYKPVQVQVGDKTVFNIVMTEATNSLDQVVVQAYGQTSQRLNTGDIATVSGKDIEKQPVMNPLLALEGQVPGLDVQQTSGYQSAPVKVELRGRSSISGLSSSDPLYVVDGVPLSVVEVGGGSSYAYGSSGFIQNGLGGPAGGQSPLFSLNSADIESISVLKDADALAIYGSRGANGVILITTKKGKAGKTNFNGSFEEGYTHLEATTPLLNTQQYIQVRKEAFKNDGITPNEGNAYDLLSWTANPYTNWEKLLLDGVGKSTDFQGSLSGGNNLTTYRISGGYGRLTTPFTLKGSEQKYSLSLNITNKSLNQKFVVSFTSDLSYANVDLTNLTANFLLPPNAPPIYDAQGNLNFVGWTPVRNQYPFAGVKRPYDDQTAFTNSTLNLSYEFVKGLVVSTNFGMNYSSGDQYALTPIAALDPLQNPLGNASFGNNTTKNLIIQPQITYDRTIGKGKLSALLGGSLQYTSTDGKEENGYGYTSDYLIKTISDAPTVTDNDFYGEYKFASFFGRINYNWGDKYLINISARRDGSSVFGPNREYGNFGAIGVAYIFTEEQWFKDKFSFLSFGKVRASYGTTGNSTGVGYYGYISRYSASGLFSYDGITQLQPTQHANPDFQWEVDKKLEFGLDLGFLKDRILFSGDYYRNRVGNQLLDYPTPAFTGFTSVVQNLRALVQNAGEEFTLKAKLIDGNAFKWNFNFNIAFNQNKLVSFPGLANSPYRNTFIVGQPLNTVKLLHYLGVDPLTGQYQFEDKNHNGVIEVNSGSANDPTNDLYAINTNPKYFGGFGTDFSYKDFQLSLFFNYKQQMAFNTLNQGRNPGSISNQLTSILGKEWQYPGDIATVAGFTTQYTQSLNNFRSSDAGYTNASFIRLKNLVFSYNLPKLLVNKIGLNSVVATFTAQNLFVISPFQGDPEVTSLGALPPPKYLLFGLKINL
ncbi:MAG: SusC/RagA family TonB-linked outer membrane protein [Mucilaginibacter sp.]